MAGPCWARQHTPVVPAQEAELGTSLGCVPCPEPCQKTAMSSTRLCHPTAVCHCHLFILECVRCYVIVLICISWWLEEWNVSLPQPNKLLLYGSKSVSQEDEVGCFIQRPIRENFGTGAMQGNSCQLLCTQQGLPYLRCVSLSSQFVCLVLGDAQDQS